ncbi:MAG: hypothetical protein COA86_09750 [Kangiella sp.]|nr:MAG: hypothetical protein COA86_09750 [Kangiella sp.]
MKIIIFIALIVILYSTNAQAYVGPGLGVGVIGAIVGVVGAILMAIIGVFWYPLKRLFGKGGDDDENLDDDEEDSEKDKT